MNGNSYELSVHSEGYTYASAEAQNIMQNLLDSCDGAVLASSDLVLLSQVLTAMVEHEDVMTVTVSRGPLGHRYRFRIHYESTSARIPRTDVVAEDMGYDASTSMLGEVLGFLTQGKMTAILGVGILGKGKKKGGQGDDGEEQ